MRDCGGPTLARSAVTPRVVQIRAHAARCEAGGRVGGAGEPYRHLAAVVRVRDVVTAEGLRREQATYTATERGWGRKKVSETVTVTVTITVMVVETATMTLTAPVSVTVMMAETVTVPATVTAAVTKAVAISVAVTETVAVSVTATIQQEDEERPNQSSSCAEDKNKSVSLRVSASTPCRAPPAYWTMVRALLLRACARV